jgi:serine/threonine-protein kinase
MSDPIDNPAGNTPTQGGQSRFRRAESIYFDVAGMAQADREDAIVRLCAGDKALEQEVRSLVSSAAAVGGFLDAPALGKGVEQLTRESDTHDTLIGARVGQFTVTARIASGGMGTVYKAQRSDNQFAQVVAIKVVKRGLDSEEVLKRFADEKQTLASLDNPAIARLIDAGVTADGRPYFAMEFVDGKPIDTYCDENRLSVRERLRLFMQACHAVHAAHQSLVIHRDIKPSNILVTPAGQVKLLDFGIAKWLKSDVRNVTAETDRRLTPEYASPEQVDGSSITTASDVYSLGVVLYELLTGARPYYFGPRTTEEVKRLVCLQVPPVPSEAVTIKATRIRSTAPATPATPIASANVPTERRAPVDTAKTRGVSSTRLRGQLRGDLDNIIMMALRKEPQRRYVSAEQLAAEVQRYLEGLPVQARRDTLSYRVSKFVRRHAVGVVTTAAVIALLSAATVTLYRQREQIRTQRDTLVITNAQLRETKHFLIDTITAADIGNSGPETTLGEALLAARDAMEEHPISDAATRAATQQAIGRSMLALGMTEEAQPLLAAAQQFFGTMPATDESRLEADADSAQVLFFTGENDAALKALRDVLTRERTRSGGTPTAFEASLLNDIGAVQKALGDFDGSLATHREALAIKNKIYTDDLLPASYSYHNMGDVYLRQQKYDLAVESFSQAVTMRAKQLRPTHPLVLASRASLGLALVRSGNAAAAVEHLELAAEHYQAAFGSKHPGNAAAWTSLGQAYRELGRYDDAIAAFDKTVAWQNDNLPTDAPQKIATRANIAIAKLKRGDDGADAVLRATLEELKQAKGNFAGIIRMSEEALKK